MLAKCNGPIHSDSPIRVHGPTFAQRSSDVAPTIPKTRRKGRSPMEKRELYKKKYEAQVHEWSARVQTLVAQTEKLTAKAQLDAKPRLDALHGKLATAKGKLHEITEATDERWDDVVKAAETVWTDLKASVEGAYDTLKHPSKKDG